MKTHLEFCNGTKFPIIGYGTWQSENAELERGLDLALAAGYRHFDTAFGYQNEAIFGKVLTRWFESGKVKREELFITTKLPIHGSHHERVEMFLKKQLKDLQLDYVDLYLVHNPACIKADGFNLLFENGECVPDLSTTLEQMWGAMEAQVTAGRAKSIGLSNFNEAQMDRIVKCAKILPVNNQIEVNASYPRKALREACAKHGITVTAFAPLGSPGRKAYYEATRGKGLHLKVNVPNLLGDPVVAGIATKHSKTPAQVLLRFLAQQEIVVIPKSLTPARITENIDIFDFELDAEDMQKLNALRINDDEGTWGFDWASSLPGLEKHPEFQLASSQL